MHVNYHDICVRLIVSETVFFKFGANKRINFVTGCTIG